VTFGLIGGRRRSAGVGVEMGHVGMLPRPAVA
jgi:hypothetical protein